MQQADFDVKDFEDEHNRNGVYARFYYVPKEDKEESAKAGRPVFKDKEYVEIIAAGNANNIVRRPVSELDRNRFRQEYAQFKAGDKEQLFGTPLSEVTWISRSQVEELMYRKVRTVEQLAELSDSVCGGTPGLYELKRKAAQWVEKASKAAPLTALQKENEDLRARLEALEAMASAKSEDKVPKSVAKAVEKTS